MKTIKTIERHVFSEIVPQNDKFLLYLMVFKKRLNLRKAAKLININYSQAKVLIKIFRRERQLLKRRIYYSRNRSNSNNIIRNNDYEKNYNITSENRDNKNNLSIFGEMMEIYNREIERIKNLRIEISLLRQKIIFNQIIIDLCTLIAFYKFYN